MASAREREKLLGFHPGHIFPLCSLRCLARRQRQQTGFVVLSWAIHSLAARWLGSLPTCSSSTSWRFASLLPRKLQAVALSISARARSLIAQPQVAAPTEGPGLPSLPWFVVWQLVLTMAAQTLGLVWEKDSAHRRGPAEKLQRALDDGRLSCRCRGDRTFRSISTPSRCGRLSWHSGGVPAIPTVIIAVPCICLIQL